MGGYPRMMSRREYIKSETIDQIEWSVWLIFVPLFAGLLPLFIFGPRIALWILGGIYAFGLVRLTVRFVIAWRESAWRR